VSLVFPLVLAPRLGLTRTAFAFGILNVGIALWAARVFRQEVPHAAARAFRGSLVLGLLIAGFAFSDRLTHFGEKGLFGDEIVAARTTPYQRLVITRWKDDLRLYINGNLQFSSRDEHRYHEALVHPALERMPWARSALVLGGGDGLAVREILKHKNIERVTLVDLDEAMTGMFSTAAPLTELNQGSLTDARVHVVNADAARWLESDGGVYDIVIADFPDPSNYALGKLYSVPVFKLVARHLSEHGFFVVQSTSPYFAPHAYWCVDATLKEAGFRTWPYHAYVPSFGEWGFILAGRHGDFSPPAHYSVATRFLDAESTRLMFEFPPDMRPLAVEPHWLNTQALVRYFEQDWGNVMR
jgi:spermidine synthase